MSSWGVARSFGVAVVVLAAGACSSPTSSNGSPSDLSSTGKARLADYCAKREMCALEQNMTVPPCPASMCLARTTVEAALVEFFGCQIAKPCSSFFSDDDCIGAAGTSDAERDAFAARCLAKIDECADDFGDACGAALPLFPKQWMRAVDACIGRACADVQACVDLIPIEDCWD